MWREYCNFEKSYKTIMIFTGRTEVKVDSKGRVFMPASFRKILQENAEERLILKKDAYQPCLVVYPYSIWEERVAFLRSTLNKWDRREAMILRQFVADVEVVSLDSSGRFLISKNYLSKVGIEHDVTILGVDDTIEIWRRGLEEEAFMNEKDFADLLESKTKKE